MSIDDSQGWEEINEGNPLNEESAESFLAQPKDPIDQAILDIISQVNMRESHAIEKIQDVISRKGYNFEEIVSRLSIYKRIFELIGPRIKVGETSGRLFQKFSDRLGLPEINVAIISTRMEELLSILKKHEE